MPDNTLSTEERDFIRSVFSAPPSNGGATTPLRPDTASTLSQSLLARLSEQATLSLHAQLDDCRVIFPLQMVKDAEHGPHLKLGTPSLLEDGLLARGSITRLWRLDLEKPLELLTRYGSNSGMQVEQLAPGGLVLASPDTTPPPRFSLWLALPGERRLPLHGLRVRRIGPHRAAYRLEIEREQAGHLSRYIFEQYRLHHSSLQAG